MPTIELLKRARSPIETICYAAKDNPTFSVDIGSGEREYTYSESTNCHEKAVNRYNSLKMLPGRKKRLTVEFKDGRKFVLAREIRR